VLRNYRVIYLHFILNIFVTIFWATTSPVGSSADEDFHLASIVCARGEANYCKVINQKPDSDQNLVSVPHMIHGALNFNYVKGAFYVWCFLDGHKRAANCPKDDVWVNTNRVNSVGQNETIGYPTLFYRTMNKFVYEDNSTYKFVFNLRLINGVFLNIMILGTLLIWARFNKTKIIFPYIIAFNPLFLFTISSINPSSWEFVGLINFFILIQIALKVHRYRDNFKFITLIYVNLISNAILVIGARPTGILFLGYSIFISLLIYLLTNTRKIHFRNVLLFIFPMIYFLIKGLENAWVESTIQIGMYAREPSALSGFDLLFKNISLVPRFILSMTGWDFGFGWKHDHAISHVFFLTYVLFAIIILSMVLKQAFFNTKIKVLIIMIPLMSFSMPLLYTLQKSGLQVGSEVQPRYLFPIFFGSLLGVIANLMTGRTKTFKVNKYWNNFFIISVVISASTVHYFYLKRWLIGSTSPNMIFLPKRDWWFIHPLNPSLFILLFVITYFLNYSLFHRNYIDKKEKIVKH
jgi:hypothetical protein